jgi:hypothetical protein
MDLRAITELALTLPLEDRTRLVRELLEGLWLEEAARRAEQIDSGAVALVPADEVSRKARTLLT